MPAMTAIPFVRTAPSGAGVAFADSEKPLTFLRLGPRSQRLGLDSCEDCLALIDGPASVATCPENRLRNLSAGRAPQAVVVTTLTTVRPPR